jgi:O-antigen/teichoic acid export membrane protein
VINKLSILDIGAVFAGRMGGILVNLVFLPIYRHLLTPWDFGAVSLILSLQALLMVLDLGLSTLIGRDFAAAKGSPQAELEASKAWMRGEGILLAAYIGAFLVGLATSEVVSVAGYKVPWHLLPLVIITVCFLFLLVLQNLALNVLIGAQRYRVASTSQVLGSLIRAGATVIVLMHLGSNLRWFLITQSAVSLLHLFATKYLCREAIRGTSPTDPEIWNFREIKMLLRRCRPLILFGVAGAAAMQLDKPIISAGMSVAALGPYFLAGTYAMTPIAVVVGPFAQYFQPRIATAMARGNVEEVETAMRQFVLLGVTSLIVTTAVLWLFRTDWIMLWLHQSQSEVETADLVKVLLPAAAIGSLGYFPSLLLVGTQDFRFIATLAATITIVLLTCVAFAAVRAQLTEVTYAYLGYHFASTAGLFIRSLVLKDTAIVSRIALVTIAKLVIPLVVAMLALYLAIDALPFERYWSKWLFALSAPLVSFPAVMCSRISKGLF